MILTTLIICFKDLPLGIVIPVVDALCNRDKKKIGISYSSNLDASGVIQPNSFSLLRPV